MAENLEDKNDVIDHKDEQLSESELKKIEELTVPMPPEAEWRIKESEDKLLKGILEESIQIINKAETWTRNPETVRAILTFLKVKSYYSEWISSNFDWVNIKEWKTEDLVNLIWFNYNRELIREIWWDNWDHLISIIDDLFSWYESSMIQKIQNKKDSKISAPKGVDEEEDSTFDASADGVVADPKAVKDAGATTNPKDTVVNPSEQTEEDNSTEFDNLNAVFYLKTCLPDHDNLDDNTARSNYKKIMELVNTDENFVKAINALLNNFQISWLEFSNNKSDQIKAFQEKFLINDEKTWDIKVSEAWISLFWTDVPEKVADWRLWIRTLNAIINWEGTKNLLKKNDVVKSTKREITVEKENVDNEWLTIDNMPRTMDDMLKFGKYSKETWFVFSWENESDWKDFVKADPEGKKFITIKRDNKDVAYYLDDDTKDNFVKRDHKQIESKDADWNTVITYHDTIQIWSKDKDNNFIWQEFKLVDWKPKSSLFSNAPREDGSQLKVNIIRWEVNTTEEWETKEKGGDNYDTKWRIDLFKEWKDTKRLSEEDLNSLNANDIGWILDQAIQAYDITEHKPSEVGRYNLNRIVYSIMNRTDRINNLNPEFDTPKTISHIVLWMDTWFFTNPSKSLEKNHLINDDKELIKMLWIEKNVTNEQGGINIKDYQELNYNWSEKKWDQITNRLRILNEYVKANANKLNNKVEK